LVDAKFAAEEFLNAHNISCIENMDMFMKFLSFIGAFTKGKIEMYVTPQGEHTLQWASPRTLTANDIRIICE
jgi:hypothetical protein